jgi:hypothetical protein
MNKETEAEIQAIIDAYTTLVKGIEIKAKNSDDRAYGGIIRAGKGTMVESIAKQLVLLAWKDLGQKESRLKIIGARIKIPIKKEYIDNLKDEEVKTHIQKNMKNYVYPYKSDVLVAIDDKPLFEVECKAYTENAMMKRILVDCMLIKRVYPNMKFALLQLESQLGGDYSELKEKSMGSPSTHTLLSMFDIDLKIITLLKGERFVDEPIHEKEFFKPLTKENLIKAIEQLKETLKEFL